MAKEKFKRKKYVTLMLVPDDHTGVFSVRMNAVFFIGALLLWTASVIFSAYVITRHIDYRATKQMNRIMAGKQKYFAQEVLRAREAVKRVTEIDKQMRDMLQLKSKDAIIKYTGFGGPSNIDQELLEKNIKQGDELISRKAFELAVQYVDDNADASQKSFQEIIKYITEQRAKLTAVPAGWPVKGWITCGFGSRIDPFSGALSFHEGVDIANDMGTPVKAPADGVVSDAGFEQGYGNAVSMNHGNGYTTRYGHMSKTVVAPGQHIKKGQVLGYVGNSGRSTAPHLHYEVRLNNVAVNPAKFLNKEVALK